MDIQTLTSVFGWMTVINIGILLFIAIFFAFASDWIYKMRTKLFPMPRESFNIVTFSIIGFFKIFIVFFNLVPYIALNIIAGD